MGALQFTSTSAIARRFYAPMMPGVTHIPYPYCYRCLFKQTYPECHLYCLDYIQETVLKRLVCPDEIAGILFEPILGAGGYVIPPDEYWPSLQRLCKEHGILMIDDEVQTGFARTGKMWACEHWGIEPDIMCVSKAMAGGLPIGACIAKANVMDWSEGAHENTLGGNPIIVAAALAVLKVIQQERLAENAAHLGEYILKRLREIAENHEIIGDVRGKGLMIGVEFVKERKTKKPATVARNQIILNAFKRGLLILAAGQSSLRLAPPLILTHEQADIGLQIIEKVIDTAEKDCGKI
jgi:4-aminobutyrate aminotransferase